MGGQKEPEGSFGEHLVDLRAVIGRRDEWRERWLELGSERVERRHVAAGYRATLLRLGQSAPPSYSVEISGLRFALPYAPGITAAESTPPLRWLTAV